MSRHQRGLSKLFLIALVGLSISTHSAALCERTPSHVAPAPAEPTLQPTDLAGWLAARQISIRQTFDGSKNESQPASATWVVNDSKFGHDYYLVDAAVQLAEPELLPNTQCSLLFRPIIEWHRDTTAATPINALSAKVTLQFMPSQFHLNSQYVPDDTSIHPFFLLSGGPTRDLAQNSTKGTISLRSSAQSLVPGMPGGQLHDASGDFVLLYYPYVGVDWIDPVPSKGGQPLWSSVARLYVQLAPIPAVKSVELLLDYTYRYAIQGSEKVGNSLPLFIASANLYFDHAHRIALGYQFQRGHDAKDDFAFRTKSGVALKVKV